MYIITYFKKKLTPFLFILLIFFTNKSKAQNHLTLKELEDKTTQFVKLGNIESAVDFNKKALTQYEKENYAEGIISAYLNIANYLAVQNKYKESLDYLEKVEKDIHNTNNPELQSKLYGGYGFNYSLLGLYEHSNANFQKAINFGKTIKDKKIRNIRLYSSYSRKLYNFNKLNILDSIKSTEQISLALFPETLLYANIGKRFLKFDKNLDSAKYYLDKGLEVSNEHPIHQKAALFLYYGDLYSESQQYEKALGYYFQSLGIYSEEKSPDDKRDLCKVISETYKKLNKKDSASLYLERYTELNDNLINDEKKVINIRLKKIIEEKDKHEKYEKNKLYILILLILGCFGLLFLHSRKSYLQKQKKKDEIISKKSLETKTLKKKINPLFKEVTEFAKNNDPLFLVRFKEVYPDFYQELTTKYLDLTLNEIKFCALLKLNFSNKEIEKIENITLRTIETKKYRIRKKIQVPSGTDLHKWMMKI